MQVQGLSGQYPEQGIRVRIHELKDRATRGW